MWRVSSLLSGVDQACHTTGKRVIVIPENNSPEQKTRNKKAWPGLAALSEKVSKIDEHISKAQFTPSFFISVFGINHHPPAFQAFTSHKNSMRS